MQQAREALYSRANEALVGIPTIGTLAQIPQEALSRVTEALPSAQSIGTAALIALGALLLLIAGIKGRTGNAAAPRQGETTSSIEGGSTIKTTLTAQVDKSASAEGGFVAKTNAIFFGRFSAISWLVILTTLVLSSALPRELLVDYLMS